MAFEQSADDVKKVAQVAPDDDGDFALSDYAELYQMISLEKALKEMKDDDGSIAKLSAGLVAQQIQYTKLALKEIADKPALQQQYGLGLSGAKKLAKALYKKHVDQTAQDALAKSLASAGDIIVNKRKNSAFA